MPNVGGMGRRKAPDVNDRLYPMRAVLRPTMLPTHRYYKIGVELPMDQGNTGTCVAHAWRAFLLAAPLMCRNAPNPYDMYRGLILMDEWTDNDHEAHLSDHDLQSGSSVRAGAKYLQSKGFIRSYIWSRSADEMAAWILTKGTIVLGTDWHWNMGDPDKKGVVSLGGGSAGGHAYFAYGYNRVTKMFRCLNSWGKEYAQGGKFWIRHADMDTLVKADGEACAAVEQFVPPVVM